MKWGLGPRKKARYNRKSKKIGVGKRTKAKFKGGFILFK